MLEDSHCCRLYKLPKFSALIFGNLILRHLSLKVIHLKSLILTHLRGREKAKDGRVSIAALL